MYLNLIGEKVVLNFEGTIEEYQKVFGVYDSISEEAVPTDPVLAAWDVVQQDVRIKGVSSVCCAVGISSATYYRWVKEEFTPSQINKKKLLSYCQ